MDKVIDIEERIPSLREKRKRRTNRKFIFLLLLFLLVLAVLLYFQSPLSKVESVGVEGARLNSGEDYIRASGISEGDALWGFRKSESARKVASLQGVKNAEIARTGLRSVTIKVEEWEPAALIEEEGAFHAVLANGEVFSAPAGPVPAPILTGFKPGKEMNRMVKELDGLPGSVRALISEVKSSGDKENPDAITAYMSDGYEVRGVISGFSEKMAYYPSIVSQLSDEGKGVIDLEVGLYFRPYKEVYGDGSDPDGENGTEDEGTAAEDGSGEEGEDGE
ncbi:cell division protein FtsQ/DivIB [Bhargavaea ullalensis]|uniref:Cell division protein DivIB n=1 Tax=Bhargavaea ullalensis TaxID=1265685 RepID=A0ABV2GF36_9BACL